ncbi:MAG: FmdB family transcriptional regulator, partial [Candidatus Rokuibacteriota bacterium]
CPTCQSGDITRKLSVFGLKSDGNFMPSPTGGGGGCCGGGGCGCH